MIDEKKLIEDLLHNDGIYFELQADFTTPEDTCKTLDEFITKMKEGIVNLIKSQPSFGWISVKDRFPDKMGRYICRYVFGENADYPFEQVLYYYTAVEKPHFQNEGSLGMRVTHWMPLPEPPKEGET